MMVVQWCRWLPTVLLVAALWSGCSTPRKGAGPAELTPEASVDARGGDAAAPRALPPAVELKSWRMASATDAGAGGAALSAVGFDDSAWLPAAVPGTVAGAQYDAGKLGDAFFGQNLSKLPGWTYSFLPMPQDSPYRQAWWYRVEADVPAATRPDRRTWIVFEGINYSANVWVNGTKVGARGDVVGTFREFRFDVTELVTPGGRCAIAVEVFAPDIFSDLAIYWVDWNPEPPDYNMGLWMPARIEQRGSAVLRNPAVLTDLQEDGAAELTVIAELSNATEAPVEAVLECRLGTIEFQHGVTLEPKAETTIRLTSADEPRLRLKDPVLWWPYGYGEPHLVDAEFTVWVGEEVSDRQEFSFGVREVSIELFPPNSIRFSINGRPILIRGGGWAPDIFYRDDPERERWELAYVKDAGLNAIRLEGKLLTHRFYDACDREGILLLPGWCCCDTWESWDEWEESHHGIAKASLADQLRRLRRHPSVLAWLNGSDFHPVPEVEKLYLEVAEGADWNLPVVSNATETPSTVSGPSGMKMTGPYNWVPPSYWYLAVPQDPLDLEARIDWEWLYGGAFGFNSESSPGPAVPPLDSLLKMMKLADVWPVGDTFLFHSGGVSTAKERMEIFNDALVARLGEPSDAADYAWKSQIMAYESHRAMFEAQARNKYFATGFIQWMANNAWPGTIWHLWDYYLRPGGSYFGARAALRPVHVQYSYDDQTVWVVSSTLQVHEGLSVRATLYDADSTIVAERTAQVPLLDADSGVEAVALAEVIQDNLDKLAPLYFLDLRLDDGSGAEIDRSFYWLSTKTDEYEMVYTGDELPAVDYADMTALDTLPEVDLALAPFSMETADGVTTLSQTVSNQSDSIAFFLEILLVDSATGEALLPALYSDNYLSLVPHEARTVTIRVPEAAVQGREIGVRVSGTNVPSRLADH